MTSAALIQKAVEHCGSQAELARRIGGKARQGHVWKWLNAQRVSAEVAVQIERATSGVVTRHALRPDLFGLPAEISPTEADDRHAERLPPPAREGHPQPRRRGSSPAGRRAAAGEGA